MITNIATMNPSNYQSPAEQHQQAHAALQQGQGQQGGGSFRGNSGTSDAVRQTLQTSYSRDYYTDDDDDIEQPGPALTEDNWITDDDDDEQDLSGTSGADEELDQINALDEQGNVINPPETPQSQLPPTEEEDYGGQGGDPPSSSYPPQDEGYNRDDDAGNRDVFDDEEQNNALVAAGPSTVASAAAGAAGGAITTKPQKPLSKKQRKKIEKQKEARQRRAIARQYAIAVLALIVLTTIVVVLVVVLAQQLFGTSPTPAPITPPQLAGPTTPAPIDTTAPIPDPTLPPRPSMAPTTIEEGLYPPNNDCNNALSLEMFPSQSITGTIFGAQVKNDVAICDDVDINNNGRGVWYKVVGQGRFVRANTCHTDTTFDTQISIYVDPWIGIPFVQDENGNIDNTISCSQLECIVGNDQRCGSGSSVQWFGVRDQTYYILVHGYRSNVGNFVLNVSHDNQATCDHAINISQPQYAYENYGFPVTNTYRIDGQIRTAPSDDVTIIPNCNIGDDGVGEVAAKQDEVTTTNTSINSSNMTSEIGSPSAWIVLEEEGTAWYSIMGTGKILVPNVSWNEERRRHRYLEDEGWVIVEAENPYKQTHSAYADANNWIYVPDDAERPAPYGDGTVGSNVFGPRPEPINPYVSVFAVDRGSSQVRSGPNVTTSNPCDDLTCVTLEGPGWRSEEGVEYRILINGGKDRVGEFFRMTIAEFRAAVAGAPREPNFECSGANLLDADDGEYRLQPDGTKVQGNTFNAGRSIVPSCGNEVFSTSEGVWYTVMGTGEALTISTCPDYDEDNISTNKVMLDTQISVYTGSCNALQCVDGNDQACGDQSSVSFYSELNELYFVLVHGFGSRAGEFTISLEPTRISEANTECINAFVLEPNGMSILGSISSNAGKNNTMPIEVCGQDSVNEVTRSSTGVWYQVMGDGSSLIASTCSSNTEFKPQISIYHGASSCGDLACVDATVSACTVKWTTKKFESYFLFVHGENSGDFVLTVDNVVSNDNCENAIELSSLDGSTTFGSIKSASADTNLPSCDDGGTSVGNVTTITATTNATSTQIEILTPSTKRGVWYQMAGNGKIMTASTCSVHTNFNATISIWSGTCSRNNLQCTPVKRTPCEKDDNNNSNLGMQIEWPTLEGVTFSILVHGEEDDDIGNFELKVS